jgi:hypothetical protein
LTPRNDCTCWRGTTLWRTVYHLDKFGYGLSVCRQILQ